MSSGVVEIAGLTKRYGGATALDAITLTLPADRYVSLLGPSGSGKTVLLRVIAGFEAPDAGTILFGGEPILDRPAHRRGIGFVFQNFALFPHLSVAQNIAFGLENRAAERPLPRRAIKERVAAMIALVGLDGLEARGVHQISGGQRQRVALARTLVTEPRLVLLDEPLGALDANLRNRIRGELRAIRARLGVTFLHVTGSETEALAIGDDVVVLDRGRIAQVDSPDTLYARPATARVAHFLNCFNLFEGQCTAHAFAGEAGAFPLPATGAPARASRYGVRFDRIAVRAPAEPAGPGEVSLPAVFVASEYSGATLLSFFRLASGRIVEVETHLGHQAPPNFAPEQNYILSWPRDGAQVFA